MLAFLNFVSNLKSSRWASCAVLLMGLIVTIPAASVRASNPGSEKRAIDDMAISAYCQEAHKHLTPLTNGQMSYKGVALLASNRAMVEHRGVYKDRHHWLTKIIDVLDKYGDEPTSELCEGQPDS
jgi:hypothetical protein